jgi:hypothetical protein
MVYSFYDYDLLFHFCVEQLDNKYEAVACGKTPDQLEMTELAKTFTPRSLLL